MPEEDDDVLLLSGQESLQDKWLSDEEYASGKWYRFALERLLSMAQSTRLTTSQMEFLARSGWILYVPRDDLYEFKVTNVGLYPDDLSKIFPIIDEKGNVYDESGRPKFQQGYDYQPEFLVEEFQKGKKKLKFPTFLNLMVKRSRFSNEPDAESDIIRLKFSRKAKVEDSKGKAKTIRLPKSVDKRYLQRVRKWIPTPVPDGTWNQAPRLPFDMIPKPDLDDAYDADVLIRERVREERSRLMATLDTDDVEDQKIDDEFADYQYCGVPGLDEELIRAYRMRTDPRRAKLPQQFRELQDLGITLWKRGSKGLRVARWLENPAGITMRVHGQTHQNFISAKQVFDGLDRMKTYPGTANRKQYDPDPAKLIDWADPVWMLGIAEVEAAVRERLVEIAQSGPEGFLEAGRLQKVIRESFEDWIREWYDRTLPNEQLRYHEWFSDLEQIHVNNWKSRADRWWYQMQLRVCLRKPPGIVSSTSQRANFLEMELLVADFESWRNLEHMQEHWKYSKAFGNTTGSMDDNKAAPSNMRQRDWGGIWNPIRAEFDWRFAKLDAMAPIPQDRPMTEAERDLRLELLGPAWFDKQPWQMMDHDGSLIDRFGQKKVSWIGSMRKIKYLASKAGTATFPKRIEKGLDEELAEHRNYASEYDLLRNDEYFARDPVDVIENQKGLAIFSVLDDVNLRLKARFEVANKRLIQDHQEPVILDYDNCFLVQSLLVRMSKNLPAKPIIAGVEGAVESWRENNVLHLRHKLEDWLRGIHINPELRQHLERWYEESDARVWKFVIWLEEMMSSEFGASGAGSFTIQLASKLNEEGFGEGYGEFGEQQQRKERLVAIALYSGYYTEIKRICSWFSIRLTAVHVKFSITKDGGIEPDKSWADVLNELKMVVASSIKSGNLLYHVAKNDLWPRLQKISTHLNEPFPELDPIAAAVDEDFLNEQLLPLVGNRWRPSLAEANNAHTYGYITKEEVEANRRIYQTIVEGNFPAINVA